LKQSKIFWGLLVATLLLITTRVGADMILPNHNSRFYLDYGTGYAWCEDTSTVHYYMTDGRTYGAPNTRVAVYVLDKNGVTIASDSTSANYNYARAEWTQSDKTEHKHQAGSALIQ
jgi:hypothetical protein